MSQKRARSVHFSREIGRIYVIYRDAARSGLNFSLNNRKFPSSAGVYSVRV